MFPRVAAVCGLATKQNCSFISYLRLLEVIRPLSGAAAQQSQQGRRADTPDGSHASQLHVNTAERAAASLGGRVGQQQRVLGASFRHLSVSVHLYTAENSESRFVSLLVVNVVVVRFNPQTSNTGSTISARQSG